MGNNDDLKLYLKFSISKCLIDIISDFCNDQVAYTGQSLCLEISKSWVNYKQNKTTSGTPCTQLLEGLGKQL